MRGVGYLERAAKPDRVAGAAWIQVAGCQFAIVDEADEERVLAAGAWSLHIKGYAACRRILMHRLVMDAGPRIQIDHRNQNKLDNRRENLRVATDTQQRANSKRPRHNTSGYKGVSKNIRGLSKPWRAYISGVSLGGFDTAEEAAMAYDVAAVAKFGEFASLNFRKENV